MVNSSFRYKDFVVDYGLDEMEVASFEEALAQSSIIIAGVDTSNGTKLPNDDIIKLCYLNLFKFGSVLNRCLAEGCERLVGNSPSPRSSSIVSGYNVFYQNLFSEYLKPLNKIITFHENRLR